jgi:putative ATP-dependent endonuclease of OLD family
MLRVRRVVYENYRGVKRASLLIDPHVVLIGANNCGKTALLEGIALALGRDRVLGPLDDYDFFEGFYALDDPLARRFTIRVLLVGFEPNSVTAHPQWFNFKSGTTPFWWDDEAKDIVLDGKVAAARGLPLAVEIRCTGYYDDEESEYRTLRHFSGPGSGDPFDDESATTVPGALLRSLGVYLLPSRRVWDSALTFAASSFTRVVKEQHAIPDDAIGALRRSLANPVSPPEVDSGGESSEFGSLVTAVESTLRQFGLLNSSSDRVRYRPTRLDAKSLLESLTPHVDYDGHHWLPLSTQGDGVIALQNLLLLLEIGRRRRQQSQGFILLLEEPELHVHPTLQRQLVSMTRGAANQTLTTTHSPFVAASFAPQSVQVLSASGGIVVSTPLVPTHVELDRKNLLKRYTHQERLDFLGAVMGAYVLVPEGEGEADWLRALVMVAESHSNENFDTHGPLLPLSVLRTKSGKLAESVEELRRLGCTVVTLTDGDAPGLGLAQTSLRHGASRALRWPTGWAIEQVVSRVCRPVIADLRQVDPLFGAITDGETFCRVLCNHKRDYGVRQAVVDVMLERPACRDETFKLVADICSLALSGSTLTHRWPRVDDIHTLDAF